MINITRTLAVAGLLLAAPAMAGTITLDGRVRDFCAPSIANTCTAQGDMESTITGLNTGMVANTLSGGLPVYVTGGDTSTAEFNRWYRDTAGYNFGIDYDLTLSEASPGSGVYSYSDNTFFPIDGQGYGNQSRSHNYHFTYQLWGQTSFLASDSFTFTGDDDLWVFINGQLVMDLGGVHGALTRTITGQQLIDLYGLAAGTVYSIDIFFAERHTTESNFVITTSFRISQVPEPATLGLLGLGLAGIGFGVRRRKA